MSQMYDDPGPATGGGGGNILTDKHMGVPGWMWLAGAGILAYFFFFRNSSGSSGSTGGSGSPQTGDITLNPGTTSITVTSPVTSSTTKATGPNKAQTHRTSNPQPKAQVKAKTSKTSTSVAHKAGPAPTVTVAKWTSTNTPWNSTLSGIASRYHTTIAALLKLNPQIKNPNLIYTGEKIKT